MKILPVVSILVFANVIQCSSWFSFTRWFFGPNGHRTIPALDVPGEPNDQTILDALKAEAAKGNSISIFVNRVIVNEAQFIGALYYSGQPKWFEGENNKILLVESLHFMNYPDSLPWTKECIEELKRKLVKKDIFLGVIEPVLVGNVKVNHLDLGPIFLHKPFSFKATVG
jgi:hypothetical protein